VTLRAFSNNGPFDNTWTAEDIKVLVREVVLRYCERTQHNALCNKYGNADEDLEAKVSTWVITRSGADVITIQFAADNGGGQTGDIQELLFAAIGDDYAPTGYNFVQVVNQDTNPTIIAKPPSDASTTAASILLLVIAAAYLM